MTKLSIALILMLAISVAAQIKVACIGNSITSGYQSTGISYVPKLQALLGADYIVQNNGVSGTTLLKKGDNPYWSNGLLSQVRAFMPDIITIKLGTNDTKPYNWDVHGSEFKKDYEALIDTLYNSPVKPTMYLVLAVPVFYNVTTVSWGIRDSIINKINAIIKQIGKEKGLTVIDAHRPLRDHPEHFTVDGIHPDAAGADIIAQAIFKGITQSTAVVSKVSNQLRYSNITSSKKYSIFNEYDCSVIFSDVKEGSRYTIAIYTANGTLQSTFVIDSSPHSRKRVINFFKHNCTMKWVVASPLSTCPQ